MSCSVASEIIHDTELLECQPVSKQDFSYRRSFISPDIFAGTSRLSVSEMYLAEREHLRYWKGFHVLAADGSILTLPASVACRSEFGGDPKGNPSGQALFVVDVLNCLCLASSLSKFGTAEREKLVDMLPDALRLSSLTGHCPLLLLDRGYPSYDLFAYLMKSGVKFVIRMPLTSNVVQGFLKSDSRESFIEMTPPEDSLQARAAHILRHRKNFAYKTCEGAA